MTLLFRHRGFEITKYRDGTRGEDRAILQINDAVLNDRSWAEAFGGVEHALSGDGRAKFAHVRIDLRKCTWADPLPMMALLIFSANLKHSGCGVEWQLRHPQSSPPDTVATDLLGDIVRSSEAARNPRTVGGAGRLLRFLAKEGFLMAAVRAGVGIVAQGSAPEGKGLRDEIARDEDVRKWMELSDEPAYVNATIVEAQLLDFPPFGESARAFVFDEVDRQLSRQSLVSKLQSLVGHKAADDMLASLRLVLTETLLNISEHAYPAEQEFRPGAYYVRLRYGLPGANQAQRDTLKAFLDAERKDSPRVGNAYLSDRRGCVEIFVSDAGTGLVGKLLKSWPELNDARHPFLEYVRKVLVDGLSSNQDRRTAKGALSLIYANAARRGDYVRCMGNSWWLGTTCPMPRESASLGELATDSPQVSASGLHWHIRIGWDGVTEDKSSWMSLHDFPDAKDAVLRGYVGTLSETDRETFAAVKVRLGRDAVQHTDLELGDAVDRLGVVVWITDRNLIKNEILRRVEAIAFSLRDRDNQTLVIVDIPPYEAAAYQWALNGLRADHRQRWPIKICTFVLITTSWTVCVIERNDSLAQGLPQGPAVHPTHSAYTLSSKGRTFIESVNSEELNATWIVRFIKWYSSLEFWRHVIKVNAIQAAFFNGPVHWVDDAPAIERYLDFGEVAQNTATKRLLSREFRRFVSVVSSGPVRVAPMDAFAASVTGQRDFHIDADNLVEERTGLVVGSVIVSGTTLSAYSFDAPSVVHFLAHPASHSYVQATHPVLLHWPTGDDWFNRHFDREQATKSRIGKTAAIAELGNKYYELPRFFEGRASLAACHPAQMYRDFQEVPTILRTGHWRYGTHHDVLTPNIRLAVDSSVISGSGPLMYLGACICGALSLRNNQLTTAGRNALANAKLLLKGRPELTVRASAVVYPSHPNATYLIDKFLEYFVLEEHESEVRGRIVGVANIRNSSQRLPMLVSPAAKERLKILVSRGRLDARGVVLIVDDAVITGKTHREIVALVHECGATDVHTAVLFDRRRLHGTRLSVDKVYAYWKVDIPLIGEPDSCPVCAAIEELRSVSLATCSAQLRAHIGRAAKRWEPVDPNDWHEALPTTAMAPADVKYGLHGGVVADPRSPTVQLRSSTAATLWQIELETMTGLELGLSKLRKLAGVATERVRAVSGPQTSDLFDIELTSATALYFAGVSSPARRAELVEDLFRAICRSQNSGDHTSFACIAVLASLRHLAAFGPRFFDELAAKWVAEDTEALSDDARMLLVALLLRGAVSINHAGLSGVARLLSPSHLSIAQLYNLFHNELLSPIGTTHSRPLAKLGEGRTNFQLSSTGEQSSVREAMDSCDFILQLTSSLPTSLIRSGTKKGAPSAKDIVATLRRESAETRQILEATVGGVMPWTVAAEACRRLLQTARDLRSRLFCIPSSIDALVRTCCNDAAAAHRSLSSDSLKITPAAFAADRVPRPREEQWVVWDQEIHVLLTDIVGNAVQRSAAAGQIGNPWSSASTARAHVWFRLHFSETRVNVQIANLISGEFDRAKFEAKGAIRFRHLHDVGGEVGVLTKDEGHENVIVVTVALPYAGLCKENS